jgi:hypothetical protein
MSQAEDCNEQEAAPLGLPSLTTLSFCIASDDGTLLAPLLADPKAPLLAARVRLQDRYEILRELGRGGMGCVYLARDERLDRLVAIKVVARSKNSSLEQLDDALAYEARLGAGLNHPAIAAVYDFGFHQGRAFTVFEYVDGEALRDVLERRRRLALDDVRAIVATLARALDYAHSRGIVHRDLKPENVRASRQGQFKVLDLGLAQEFRSHRHWATFAGTPAYASPEQASGLPSDGRADQYALAIMTYEMLVGERPFNHEDPRRLLHMHRVMAPVPPSELANDLPKVVCASVVRALEKDPNRRFASCEEFAMALGAGPFLEDGVRAAIGLLSADRHNFYLCHAGEDSPLARQLAQALEQRGYSSWRYGHDALPGVSFFAQTSAAIQQADAVILFVSGASLGSSEVARDVHEAQQLRRPFLPVLLGVSRSEFQRRQPDWQPIIGAAATIDLHAGNVASVAERLIQTLDLWRIPARPRPERQHAPHTMARRRDPHAPQGPSEGSRRIWASDANQIDIADLDFVVFRNEVVDDFLERRNKFFVSAGKGLGKTLLLTFKRSLLWRSYQNNADAAKAPVIFVPQGRPYLDFMSDVRSLSKHHEQLLSDLGSAKRMWSVALSVSALSHHPHLMTPEDAEDLALFPRRMAHWASGSPIPPTVVFKELLRLSVGEINRLIDGVENFLDHKLRQVHSATYFFIDKVDQALRQTPQEAWIHVQAGLIEAAWDAMNANSHLRIYASIRQEAFSNYDSDIKANLFGAATMIRYSEEELHQMLDQLARCYESCESFQDFIGVHVVKHQRRPFPEDSFRYVRRHTLNRPRDLVIVASKLSAHRKTMNEAQFCRLVNETSAAGLVSNVFDEMSVFLNCLQEKHERHRFFGMLPYNVLTREEAIRISCRFNGLTENDYPLYQMHAEGLYHPFCDLHRVGLLGVIDREPNGGKMRQRFQQPDDLIADLEWTVPDSPFYLLHPALDGHISQLHRGPGYRLFQLVTLGDGLEWEDYFGLLCQLERCLFALQDTAVAEAAYRLLSEARAVLASDRRVHLRSVLEASSEYLLLKGRRHDPACEELNYWLDDLAEYGDASPAPGSVSIRPLL